MIACVCRVAAVKKIHVLAKYAMHQTLLQVQTHGTSVVSSWAGGRPGLPICSSWGQAVQYLDFKRVHKVCIPAWLCHANDHKHDSPSPDLARMHTLHKLLDWTDFLF